MLVSRQKQSIFIRSPSSKIITAAFYPSKKVSEVKSEIQARLGLLPSEYFLQLSGRWKILSKSECSLADYDIHANQTLDINLPLCGGPTPSLSEKELSGMKVWQLEKILQDRGLSKRGKKSEKIARYLEAQAKEFQRQQPMTQAEKMAKSRAKRSEQKRQNDNDKDAKRMANVRSEEKTRIIDRMGGFNAKLWEVPGKDYELQRHEDNPETAAVLFYSNNGSWVNRSSDWRLAFIHVKSRLEKNGNVAAVDKLCDLYLLSVERYDHFIKTVYQIFGTQYLQHAREYQSQRNESTEMKFEEAVLEWFALSASISIDELKKTKLDPPKEMDIKLEAKYDCAWMKSLEGLRLSVPQNWWIGQKGKKLWPGSITRIDYSDKEDRYFIFKCDDEDYPQECPMLYETILKYADNDQPDISLPATPIEREYVDKNFYISCGETLQELGLLDADGESFDFIFSDTLLHTLTHTLHAATNFFCALDSLVTR